MTAVTEQPQRAVPDAAPPASTPLAAAVAILLFAVLSLSAAATSRGFLEADGCTHYLYARFALQEPHFLVNVWGRPLFTSLYAIPSAYAGLAGARTLSLLLAIACSLVAFTIARGQRYRWPVLALIFTLAQPLVFLHSISELTELPFALLLGLAFLAYQRQRWLAMAVLVGLGPLGRPEGLAFLLASAIVLMAHRRWWWIAILPIPLILWNHAGWMLSGREGHWWLWLAQKWPYTSDSLYPPGSPLHFVALLPAVTSPLVFPATCLGIWRSLRPVLALPSLRNSHLNRCQLLIAAIPIMILIGHSVLYATGKLASSGELRYMLTVAPFWGLLSAKGWEWVFARLNVPHPLLWAGVAALGGALGNAVYPVVPLKPTEDYLRAQRFVEWYRKSGLLEQYPRVCAAQPAIYFLLDFSPTDSKHSLEFRREAVSPPPPGTILVWDPIYSLYNADARRSIPLEELLRHGWIEAPDPIALGGGWRTLVSEINQPSRSGS